MKTLVSLLVLAVLTLCAGQAQAAQARAALIKEQGVTFAVVHVQSQLLSNNARAQQYKDLYEEYFKVPVVLMSTDSPKIKWFGRGDIVDFISEYKFEDLPWKVYNLRD